MKQQPLKILSLEDSISDYEFICELLNAEEFDFTIQRAEKQQEFIHALQNDTYDVILSDFSLPDFNAFGALESVLEICPKTPFIVVSGSIGEETAIELIKKGAVDYVLKDRIERLVYSVKRALEQAKEIEFRKNAESKLVYEQYLMQVLMDNIPYHIYFKDVEGRFIKINNSFAKSIGLNDANEAIGKSETVFFDKEHALISTEEEQQIMKTKVPVIDKEEKVLILDKIETWYLASRMPLQDLDGSIIGTFGISKDITARKKMQFELQKRNNDLEYFHKFTVNREIKMVELKKELNLLLKEAGKDQKYLLTDE